MTISQEQAPLLPQVKKILGNMGYKSVPGSSGLYIRQSPLNQTLSISFLEVTNRQVKPFANPSVKELSHMAFVTKNVKYLFD